MTGWVSHKTKNYEKGMLACVLIQVFTKRIIFAKLSIFSTNGLHNQECYDAHQYFTMTIYGG